MNTSFFQNPTTKSFSFHLLLLVMFGLILWYAPKIITHDEPISVSLIKKKSHQSKDFLARKTLVAKENISAKEIGESSEGNAKTVKVSDLGMKLSPKSWTSHVISNALHGGDYIEDARQADQSILNTKESIYASFFERFQRQLLNVGDEVYERQLGKLVNSGRQIPIKNYYVTKTLVTLNSKGEIVKVQVLQESGVSELDTAALVTLNKAGPYPNPPSGLKDESGNAEFPLNFIIRN